MIKRFGRPSPGMLVALALLLTIVVTIFASGGSMFSPGPLSTQSRENVQLGGVVSHAELEGRCAACHAAPWSSDSIANRCLECHTDVKAQLEGHQPLHGTLSVGMQCRQCHTEHNGPHAALTKLDRFDHNWTAFALTGKHQAVACQSCHVNNVYKATSQACVSCHNEPQAHKGRYGTSCNRCHTTDNWQASLAKFDHNRTGFKITGKHQALECAACHVNNVFQGTSTKCVSCHAEPAVHKGRFSTDCVRCHNTSTWATTLTALTSHFDHTLTGFRLTGKHQTADCKSCHVNNQFKGLSQTCLSCHAEPQVHKGRFGTDCARCHSTTNWGATLKNFDHNLTAFKLTGKHETVDCKACHVNNVFKGTSQSCVSCHAEPVAHKGRFGTDCAKCHTTANWHPSPLMKFDHNLAAFKLTGKHQEVDCKVCHVNNVFKGTAQACVSCHAEPQVHRGKFGTDCAHCHTTTRWTGATFKHTFPLNHGKRREAIACATCHTVANDYKSYTCYGCHEHQPAQMARKHRRLDAMQLLQCARCHPTGREGKGK